MRPVLRGLCRYEGLKEDVYKRQWREWLRLWERRALPEPCAVREAIRLLSLIHI